MTLMVSAQKRELRKIEKAVQYGQMTEALEIFNSIEESEVEDKYSGQYKFYKAAVVSGVVGDKKPTYEDIQMAENLIAESKAAGYEDKQLMAMVENAINSQKIQIVNSKLQSGKTEEAIVIVEDIYEADNSNKDMLFTSAQLSYQVSDFDAARKKFQELFDAGYTGETVTFYAKNKSTGQEEVFPSKKLAEVAISTAKSHTDLREDKAPSKLGTIVNNLVWLYKNDDQMQKAKFVFEKAQQRFPEDASLKIVTPDIYNTLGMTEEYKKAIANRGNDITDPQVYNNLASAAFKSKDYDNAIQYYTSSLELKEDSYAAHVNLSNAYLEKGNLEETTAKEQQVLYKEALSHLERAHELKPDDKNILPTMVSLYGVFEMTEKAEAIKAKM
ncbi:hypothetical protein BST97_00625 [Nonlabens spongiae]|uniref:Uncharacterized protein n=2 Tax=Nonlabens spongiae TaxID=331648 RepID=A0A1W6MGC4_9FLAO|nr:hypothetical protein BST97_00625 [Nonlabens spongiae]